MNSSKSLLIKAVTVKCFKEKSLCIPARSLMFLTDVVGESPLETVEDEPAFLPGLDLAAHFDEVAPTGLIGDGQMEAGIWVVSSRLDVAMKIKVVFPHWEVATQQTGLWGKPNEIKHHLESLCAALFKT